MTAAESKAAVIPKEVRLPERQYGGSAQHC
jgi:hypothetical protein